MGLSDRIFRRKTDQTDSLPLPEAAVLEPAAPAAIPDATVILPPPAAQGEPQTMIIAAEHGSDGEGFPTPPPTIETQHAAPFDSAPVVTASEPAAADPQQPGGAVLPPEPKHPGFRERGRLRRRLRYLRQIRELGYRDLGGLVFDQHRFERGDEALVEGKVLAIETLDREIRALEEVLQLQTPYAELFIPGVSACARCGTLHGSDAHFCPHCGLAFGGPSSVAGLGSVGANSVYDVGQQQPAAPPSDPFNAQPGSGPPA